MNATPLISRSGGVVGVFLLMFKERRQSLSFALRAIDTYARMAATVIEAIFLSSKSTSSPNFVTTYRATKLPIS